MHGIEVPDAAKKEFIRTILSNQDAQLYLTEEYQLRREMLKIVGINTNTEASSKPKKVRDRFKPVPLTQTSRPNAYQAVIMNDVNEALKKNGILTPTNLKAEVLPRCFTFLSNWREDIGDIRLQVIVEEMERVISQRIADPASRKLLLEETSNFRKRLKLK